MRRDEASDAHGRFAEHSQCARRNSNAFVSLIFFMHGIGFPGNELLLEKKRKRRVSASRRFGPRRREKSFRRSATVRQACERAAPEDFGPKSDISRIGRSRYPQRAKRIGRILFPAFGLPPMDFLDGSILSKNDEERRCRRFRLFSCQQNAPALARQDDDCRRGRIPRRAGSRSFKAPDPTGACWIDCRAHRAWKAINRAIRSRQGRSGSSADVRLFRRIRMSLMVFSKETRGLMKEYAEDEGSGCFLARRPSSRFECGRAMFDKAYGKARGGPDVQPEA